jgi:hypothetical protein
VLIEKIGNIITCLIASKNYIDLPENLKGKEAALLLLKEYAQILREVSFAKEQEKKIVDKINELKEHIMKNYEEDHVILEAYNVLHRAAKSFLYNIVLLIPSDSGIHQKTSGEKIKYEDLANKYGIFVEDRLEGYDLSINFPKWYIIRPGDIIQSVKVDENTSAKDSDELYTTIEKVTIKVTEINLFAFTHELPIVKNYNETIRVASDYHRTLQNATTDTKTERIKTPESIYHLNSSLINQ